MATTLGFTVLDTDSCKTFMLADVSHYVSQVVNPKFEIITPYSEDSVELFYNVGGLTRFNSSNLGITKIGEDLQSLPDGLYTVKMSIGSTCNDWVKKQFFRVCQLECKYHKAVLKLGLSECKNCYDSDLKQKIYDSWLYIEGIKAATVNSDVNKAQAFYKRVNAMLDKVLDNDCGCK